MEGEREAEARKTLAQGDEGRINKPDEKERERK